MALSFTRHGRTPYQIAGNQKRTFTDVTFDSGYVTGGEPVTAADLGLNRIDVAHTADLEATGGVVNVSSARYVQSTSKIKLYDETPAEVANAADVATTIVRVIAYGY